MLTLQSALNVLSSRQSRNEDPFPALLGLLPFFATWTLIALYLHLNPSILHNHIIPFVLYATLINAYSVGQMIVAHLTKSSFPMHNVLALPLLFSVLDSLGPFLTARFGVGWPPSLGEEGGVYRVAFLFLSLGLAVGVYGSFVVDVIVSICDYLDIWCLTIKYPYKAETEEGGGKKVAQPFEKAKKAQ